MGQARLQRHESNFLEDEAGVGRVLKCYERTGVRTWDRWRKIFFECLNSKHGCGRDGHKMAEAVYTTTSLHEWYYQELRKFLSLVNL